MSLLKKFLIILFSLFTVFVLLEFKTVPSGKLWNEYSVFYVPVEVEEELVINTFLENQIEDFVCLSKQRIPVMFNSYSVEQAMFNISNKEENDYLFKRNNFFFDSSKKYKLFYVPSAYKDKLNDIIKYFEKNSITACVDSSFSYPFILPLITLIFCIFIFFLAKNKFLHIITSFFATLFVFCNPFYVCVISALMLVILSFVIFNIIERQGAVKKLLSSYDFYFFIGFSILLSFSNSFFTGLLLLMIIICISLAYYFIKTIEDKKYNNQTFTFVLIRNARQTSLYNNKFKLIISFLTTCIFLIVLTCFLDSTKSFSKKFAKVLLPGEATIKSKDLCNLEDYCKWKWNINTFAYKSLNKSENQYEVNFPEYKKENGRIVKTEKTMRYNQEYKDDVLSQIQNLDFYSIEQVLKSQGNDLFYGFTSCSSNNITIFSIILIIFSLFVLIFMNIFAIIKKDGKK